MKWAVAAVCAYEAGAVCSRGRIPTVTALCRAHRRWLPACVLTVLAVHLYARA